VQRLVGIAAADGIAFGNAFLVDRRRVNAPKYHIKPEEVEREVLRFRRAIETTDLQLQRIKEKLYWAGGEDHTLILQAHQLILQDEQLVEQTIHHIEEDLVNAEWALRRTVTSVKQLFDQVENDYFRERRSDVDFVADHLMVTLTDRKPLLRDPPADSIVVGHEISPADMARFYRCNIRGVITEAGGRTSHSSIIARSLGIPVVVGLTDISTHVGSSDPLIVDGFRGVVVVCPDDEAVRRYQRRASRRAQRAKGLRRDRALPSQTQDGVRVRLLANVELSDEVPGALAHGAEGIGLFRTEFLYLGRRELPREEDHLADALQVLKHAAGLPVTFRTCDLGVDKLPGALASTAVETNPALGLRSIRLCLDRQPLFEAQLRGLLRAAAHGAVRIMFPMISGVEELRQAKAVLAACREKLLREGTEVPTVPVGAMIEMPSAAVTADLLAREADFFSIGTNDLTQYSMAIDRVNDQVHHLFRPFYPAILRLVQTVVAAADAAKIPVTVCGEMAADPQMTLVLVGMGVRELSMTAQAVPTVKRVIRAATIDQARVLAQRVLTLSTADEVEEEIQRVTLDLTEQTAEDEDTRF
jgi:phosphoenolpyruvate-protein phosphotransferase (PTS system enzyme I)